VLLCASTLAGCEGVLDPKGPLAAAERELLFNSTGIMLAIVIPTVLATFVFAYWFRSSNQRARYLPEFAYSGRIELLTWSVPIMTIILLGGVAWISAYDLHPAKPLVSPVKPVRVQVVSLDWKWLFIYRDQGIATVNRLVVPVETPISLELTSSGVMNSLWIPQLSGQVYTMPDMVTQLHLQADHTGTYRGSSASFSGAGFSDMHFDVEAVSSESFDRWVDSARAAGPVLDTQAYTGLLQPSSAVAPMTYRSVAPDLFDTILHLSTQPAAPSTSRPASRRAEK
jgi:cytochrome o ubiquinol oxidase subunit 2